MEITISLLIFLFLNLLIVFFLIIIFNTFMKWLDIYVSPIYSQGIALSKLKSELSTKEKIIFFLLELFIALSVLFLVLFLSRYIIFARVVFVWFLYNHVFAFYKVMLETLIAIIVGIGVVWNMVFGFYGTAFIAAILLLLFIISLIKR